MGVCPSETKARQEDHLDVSKQQRNPQQQVTTMSWVRQAIDDIKAQSYEELFPTGYGGSAKQPDVSEPSHFHPHRTTSLTKERNDTHRSSGPSTQTMYHRP